MAKNIVEYILTLKDRSFTRGLKKAALEVSKVQEIIGGARNIQLYLVSRAIKDMVRRLVS